MRILRACPVAALLVLASAANAAVVTFQFSGTVTEVPVDGVFGDIAPGDAILGSFSFDSAAVDAVPDNPEIGRFNSTTNFGMTITIGGHDFSTTGLLAVGVDDKAVDAYTILAANDTGEITLEMLLVDNTGNVFGNDHLPLSPPPLAAFGTKLFFMTAFFDTTPVQVVGEIDVLTDQAAVPEPASAAFVLIGSVSLAALARRRMIHRTGDLKIRASA